MTIRTNSSFKIKAGNVPTIVGLVAEPGGLVYNELDGKVYFCDEVGWKIMIEAYTFIEEETEGDDAGLKIVGGQFSVGEPGAGQEAVFGEGDSYPVPMAYHCTIAETTDLTITGAVDVSAILQSDDESTTSLFGGVEAGDYILVASPVRYGGVKAKIDTPAVVEPANVLAEYLQDDTPTWIPASFMAVDSDFPYEQKANVLASAAGSEQWRFGFDPDNFPPDWDQATMSINGVDYSGYRWARFRVTSEITSDPVLQQIKMHTNRMEINADGTSEYFGRSRYARDLTMHWNLTISQNSFVPTNEDIAFGNGLVLNYLLNEFAASSIDGRGGYVIVPVGMDTSIPLQMEVLWTPLNDAAGDVVWSFETIEKAVGDLLDSTGALTLYPSIDTVVLNSDNLLIKTTFKFLINKLTPGEILAFGLKRIGNDAADTYSGNVGLVNVRCVGYFWRP